MLGYGFSSKVTTKGCNVGLMADLWVKLMTSLGYEKFAIQGGDFGAGVSSSIAFKYPNRVIGIHLNYIPGNYFPELGVNEVFIEEENKYLKDESDWYLREGGIHCNKKQNH